MAQINFERKEIQIKVVYCGAGCSGKTTNLQSVHDMLDEKDRGEMVSLASRGDRTMYFDFLSLESPRIGAFTIRFQIYTVPGQARYATTRELVLRGADGLVFVADSSWERMEENRAAFEDMCRQLHANDLSIDQLPMVLQYNKRDLPDAAPASYLEFALNNNKVRFPAFEAVATGGEGVAETLNCLARLLVDRYAASVRETRLPSPIESVAA